MDVLWDGLPLVATGKCFGREQPDEKRSMKRSETILSGDLGARKLQICVARPPLVI